MKIPPTHNAQWGMLWGNLRERFFLRFLLDVFATTLPELL